MSKKPLEIDPYVYLYVRFILAFGVTLDHKSDDMNQRLFLLVFEHLLKLTSLDTIERKHPKETIWQ